MSHYMTNPTCVKDDFLTDRREIFLHFLVTLDKLQKKSRRKGELMKNYLVILLRFVTFLLSMFL